MTIGYGLYSIIHFKSLGKEFHNYAIHFGGYYDKRPKRLDFFIREVKGPVLMPLNFFTYSTLAFGLLAILIGTFMFSKDPQALGLLS